MCWIPNKGVQNVSPKKIWGRERERERNYVTAEAPPPAGLCDGPGVCDKSIFQCSPPIGTGVCTSKFSSSLIIFWGRGRMWCVWENAMFFFFCYWFGCLSYLVLGIWYFLKLKRKEEGFVPRCDPLKRKDLC